MLIYDMGGGTFDVTSRNVRLLAASVQAYVCTILARGKIDRALRRRRGVSLEPPTRIRVTLGCREVGGRGWMSVGTAKSEASQMGGDVHGVRNVGRVGNKDVAYGSINAGRRHLVKATPCASPMRRELTSGKLDWKVDRGKGGG